MIPQAKFEPAATVLKLRRLETATGTLLFLVVPLPSCPLSLAPQHQTGPERPPKPQAKSSPATMSPKATALEMATGTLLLAVSPFPSCPRALVPQHQTGPGGSRLPAIAQAKFMSGNRLPCEN